MAESHFQKVTRQGIEGNINHDYEQDDMHRVNANLDIWPYGRRRPNTSLEVARYAVRRYGVDQPTEEIPIVTPEMLEDAA